MKKIISSIMLCAFTAVSSVSAHNTLTDQEKKDGWQLLFDGKSLDHWRNFKKETISENWVVKDGVMTKLKNGGDVVTKEKYKNFDLKMEWKVAIGGNSGIFILANETKEDKKIYTRAPEIQILDNERHPDKKLATHRSGSLYDMIASPPESHKVAGEWNTVRILFNNRHLQVWQNEVMTTDVKLGSEKWKKVLNASKFKTWKGFGEALEGHIGLQEHGDDVSFRNIRIRKLPDTVKPAAKKDVEIKTLGPEKLKVLIIDGQNNHNWKETTPVLKHALEESGVFEVTVSTTPPAKGASDADWSAWNPKFSDYAAVVSNYNGQMWPAEVQKNFVNYVGTGGGFVCIHAADNSFGKWKEYNEMIAVGGWGGRQYGPDAIGLYVVDGKTVRDTTSTGRAGAHGPRRPFVVNHLDTKHPIIAGLPTKWMHAKDELYCTLCGPAKNVEVHGSAKSNKSKREEPMLMTIKYGEGRVFHTPLGHDVEAMRCRGFYELLQRGTEWSATGKVVRTVDVPEDFPTADKVSPVAPAK